MTRYIFNDNFDLFVQNISIHVINSRDPITNRTALEIATDENRPQFFDYMLKKVVNLNTHDLSRARGQIKESLDRRSQFLTNEFNAGYSRLHVAVIDGQPDVIQYIIRNNFCDPNNSDAPIGTPMQLAILLCKIECIRALIEFSVDVDFVNKHNQTALQMAIEQGIICLVPELFILSRNVNTGRYMGFTYLQLAIICDWTNVVQILLTLGADVHLDVTTPDDQSMESAVDKFSGQPRILALTTVETSLSLSLKLYGRLEHKLLEHAAPALLDIADGHGNSLLILAASVQNLDVCQSLVILGANVNLKNNLGKNALQEMLKWRSLFPQKIKKPVTVGTFLIEAGIDVNMDAWHNNEIIREALKLNNERFFNLVLENTTIVDYSIVNITTIVKRRWFSTANLVLKTMPESLRVHFLTAELANTFWKLATREQVEIFLKLFAESKIHELLDILAERNLINQFKSYLETIDITGKLLDTGETVLTSLILKNNKQFIKLVLDSSNRDVLINAHNKSGLKPIHVAMKMRNQELIEILVLEDVAFNTKDAEGNTMLSLLFKMFPNKCDAEFVEKVAKIMINGGAQLNMLDGNNTRIIEYCADAAVKQRLISFAAKKNAANSERIEMDCKVCLSNPVQYVLQCGHVYCHQCVIRCNTCPTCRKPATSRTKLFF